MQSLKTLVGYLAEGLTSSYKTLPRSATIRLTRPMTQNTLDCLNVGAEFTSWQFVTESPKAPRYSTLMDVIIPTTESKWNLSIRALSGISTGLSGTLAKRDYKSFTDLVYQFGRLRRVTPEERLLLQGYPSNWFDLCGLTNQQKFSCNGMSVPVVQYIGELLNEYEKSL